MVTVPVPWLLPETPPTEIVACRWATGVVFRLSFCTGLVVVVGFLSFVGPVMGGALAGASSLPLFISTSGISLNLSFIQPARFVAKPCAEVVASLASSSVLVSFSCFHPSA